MLHEFYAIDSWYLSSGFLRMFALEVANLHGRISTNRRLPSSDEDKKSYMEGLYGKNSTWSSHPLAVPIITAEEPGM